MMTTRAFGMNELELARAMFAALSKKLTDLASCTRSDDPEVEDAVQRAIENISNCVDSVSLMTEDELRKVES